MSREAPQPRFINGRGCRAVSVALHFRHAGAAAAPILHNDHDIATEHMRLTGSEASGGGVETAQYADVT